MKIQKITILLFSFIFLFVSCDNNDDNKPLPEKPVVEDMSGFAKGADVSWLTEMESAGILFYNAEGNKTECMSLLKSLGMNSIRLRVWVNPTDGWCNKTDMLIKAKRANDLGMRILVDFHYSDSWADPSKQSKPASWENLSFDDLCLAVKDHTTEVLTALNNWGISPEWVQVGNETGNGMLWSDGKADENMAQYASLTNYGYDAVKAVFPEAKVVVHLQEGNKNSKFRWLFDGLKNNGGKWDVIGMSLYPESDTWQNMNDDLISNINDMVSRYACEIMICETGMNWDGEDAAYNFLSDLITRTKAIDSCLGVFYWEPQCYNGWKEYQKGAFDEAGYPTKAMDAFSR
ncbi:glycosyl hydrolase 53 family protein [Labilibaculum sp. K2S]|uniref:glycoside hydrolase family 53 protein n=1 Tax=Labilibaculum sp. K2S TaxID=3056386 RepID=UPI0025A32610|nr:glycosyl hydrolase 53 family protein [Labilibaculum sp. K2S]MDM8161505.1 glycosyl hydrolase 53 family protein [Labilibaculum sp. K2S]